MPKSIFSYNLTREYPYPWFTWVVFLGGVCVTVFLTVLNLASNGYELHNVSVLDPNTTVSPTSRAWFENPPWSWMSKVISTCQSQEIVHGSYIYTENHLLRYLVGSLSPNSTGASGSVYSFTYFNDNLHDCSLEDFNLTWSGSSSSGILMTVSAFCTVYNGSSPIVLNLITSTSIGPTDNITALDIWEQNVPSGPNLGLGWQIVNWYSSYAMLGNYTWSGMWSKFRTKNDSDSPQYMVFGGFLVFDDGKTDETIVEVFAPNLTSWSSTYGADIIDKNMIQVGYNKSRNISDPYTRASVYIDGLAKVLWWMVLTDLGQASSPNIFASPQQVMELMKKSMQFILESEGQNSSMASSWSMFHHSDSPESQSNPPADVTAFFEWVGVPLPQVNATAVSTQYSCQVPKLKSAGSLFFSILVADLVFIQAIWTAFTWITAYFIERRHRDARYCDGCVKAIALGQLKIDADPQLEFVQTYSDQSKPDRVAVPGPPLLWSDNIDDRSNNGNVRSTATGAPLIWSDTIGDQADTASMRSANNLRRRNDTNPYLLRSDRNSGP